MAVDEAVPTRVVLVPELEVLVVFDDPIDADDEFDTPVVVFARVVDEEPRVMDEA